MARAPVAEAVLDARALARFRTGCLKLCGAPDDYPLYATISEGARRHGMEQLLPLLCETLEMLFDYLPEQAQIFLDNQVETARGERWDLIEDAYEARAEAAKAKGHAAANGALSPRSLHRDPGDWDQARPRRSGRGFPAFVGGRDGAAGVLVPRARRVDGLGRRGGKWGGWERRRPGERFGTA